MRFFMNCLPGSRKMPTDGADLIMIRSLFQ